MNKFQFLRLMPYYINDNDSEIIVQMYGDEKQNGYINYVNFVSNLNSLCDEMGEKHARIQMVLRDSNYIMQPIQVCGQRCCAQC